MEVRPLKDSHAGVDCSHQGCSGKIVAKRKTPNKKWQVFFCKEHVPEK